MVSHGAAFCPRFHQKVEELLLPNGVRKELVLEAENLPAPQSGHSGFTCIVEIEGAKMMVPARVEAGRFIVCEKTTVSSKHQYSQVKTAYYLCCTYLNFFISSVK